MAKTFKSNSDQMIQKIHTALRIFREKYPLLTLDHIGHPPETAEWTKSAEWQQLLKLREEAIAETCKRYATHQ